MSRRNRQERELSEPERELLVAVGRCSRDLSDLLAGARRKAQKSTAVFASEHIASALHRATEVYAEALDRAKVPTRRELDRQLAKFIRADEIRDIAEEIADTEGCWRNFLSNLERELDLGPSEEEINFDDGDDEDYAVGIALADELEEAAATPAPPVSAFCLRAPPALPAKLESLSLLDPLTSRSVTLSGLLRPFRCLIVICLPAYLPSAAMRSVLGQLDKIKEDLNYFRCGVIGITWGVKDHGKRWAKDLKPPFPLYLDVKQVLVEACAFSRGLSKIWGSPTLQYLGELHNKGLPVDPPPLDLKWTHCLHLGGAFVIAGQQDSTPVPTVLLFHRSKDSLGDLPTSERLREVALEHFCKATDQSPEAVLALMDRERRYRRPPDPSRLQLEPSSGMYYDPDTRLYYDPRSQYHYDGESGQYVYWSEEAKCYVSAQHMYAAGPNYFQAKAILQQEEAKIFAKAVEMVDSRERRAEVPVKEDELKPPGT